MELKELKELLKELELNYNDNLINNILNNKNVIICNDSSLLEVTKDLNIKDIFNKYKKETCLNIFTSEGIIIGSYKDYKNYKLSSIGF